MFFDRILELRDYAKELLEEDESAFELKPEYFVFYSHQGYIFAYFDTSNDNNDISIYSYSEGDLIPSKKHDSIIEFFKDAIPPTHYKREVDYLKKNGYELDGDYWTKKEK